MVITPPGATPDPAPREPLPADLMAQIWLGEVDDHSDRAVAALTEARKQLETLQQQFDDHGRLISADAVLAKAAARRLLTAAGELQEHLAALGIAHRLGFARPGRPTP